ncbi:uncharacterized protein LOC126909776, partial [Daktulosphaira vitifoliae]|uniref:uncharacterized protein LOC126909776 n=1 Tax=Daktulosphaira vitifoliae TaxID=58002 RepID=UPI0021A9D6F1
MCYLCDTCGMKFNFLKSLIRHEQTVHNKILYGCSLCSKKFSRKDNFSRHVQHTHGLIGTDKVLKMRSVNIENEIKSVSVKNVVNYGASTWKNFYDKGNSVKESERKNTDTKFSNTRDSDDELLLEAANKIDANSMDVQ